MGIISAVAGTVAVIAGVGSMIAAATGHQNTANTLGTISLIAGGVSLATGLASMGISAILKANTMLLEGLTYSAPGYTGTPVEIELPMIVIHGGAKPTMSMGWQAKAVALAHKMASASIITSGVGAGGMVLGTVMQSSGLYSLGYEMGRTAAQGYSKTFAGNYTFSTPSFSKPDIYGSNLSISGETGISAIDVTTKTTITKTSIYVDNISLSAKGGIGKGTYGFSGEAVYNVVGGSNEIRIWDFGDTRLSFHYEVGWGAGAKASLLVDQQGGKVGAAVYAGPGLGGEFRYRNINRW